VWPDLLREAAGGHHVQVQLWGHVMEPAQGHFMGRRGTSWNVMKPAQLRGHVMEPARAYREAGNGMLLVGAACGGPGEGRLCQQHTARHMPWSLHTPHRRASTRMRLAAACGTAAGCTGNFQALH